MEKTGRGGKREETDEKEEEDEIENCMSMRSRRKYVQNVQGAVYDSR